MLIFSVKILMIQKINKYFLIMVFKCRGVILLILFLRFKTWKIKC